MGRSRFGAGLLAALLLLGLGSQRMLLRRQAPIREALDQTAQAAYTGDWSAAGESLARAKTNWATYRDLGVVFTHHAALEAVDARFAVLEILLAQEDSLCAATAAQLYQQVEALEESHRLTWRNLL